MMEEVGTEQRPARFLDEHTRVPAEKVSEKMSVLSIVNNAEDELPILRTDTFYGVVCSDLVRCHFGVLPVLVFCISSCNSGGITRT